MRVLAGVVVAVVVLAAAPPAVAEDGWVWPVEGRVLTLYSNDDARPYAGGMHRGIDIAASGGTAVVAARAGTVTHAGMVGSSGLTVAVRTGDGRYVTSYLHLSSSAVKKGDAIAAGARIGAAGTTGRRSVPEPHLHFGVRLADTDDRYVDPLSLLPAPGAPGAPVPPAPAPAPVRAAPQAVAVPVPVAVAPRRAGAVRPGAAPARTRPRGAVHPGPAPPPLPATVPVTRRAPIHAHVPTAPTLAPAPAATRVAKPLPVPEPAEAQPGAGRALVLGGLGLVTAVLFGGVAWRLMVRANAGMNARAGSAVMAIRDRIRIGQALRRLASL